MESDNLQFMSNLEGKGYTEMGKREQKNPISLMRGSCAIMQFISLPGCSDAVII